METLEAFNELAWDVRFRKVGDDRQRRRGDHAVRRDGPFLGNATRPASTRSLLTRALVLITPS